MPTILKRLRPLFDPRMDPLIGCEVTKILPPKGFPPGRVRFRVRGELEPVQAFLKQPDGIQLYLVSERDGHWHPWGTPVQQTKRFTTSLPT